MTGRGTRRLTPTRPRVGRRGGSSTRLLAIATAALAVVPAAASAQAQGNGYLFGAPMGSFTIRGGYALPTASSEIFAFSTEQLTLSKMDFGSPALELELAFRLARSTDLVLGGGFYHSHRKSAVRDWEEEVNGQDVPIEQTTTFRRIPLTASVRQYLKPRGREVGNFAWIPNKFAPFVDAGVGIMRYDFRQQGDFVDVIENPEAPPIFSASYRSDAWTMTGQVGAGLDMSLSPRFALTGVGRYNWARADMDDVFDNFDRIDLSGFTVTAGVSVRF